MATDWAAFEQYVEEVMRETNIVGAAVSVAGPDEVIYAKGFGVKDLATKEPVTPSTLFGCASVSKSFTSMAIAQLADEGLLTIDDPVVRHIAGFRLNELRSRAGNGAGDKAGHGADAGAIEDVKLRHILSHTTGLPPMKRRQDIADFAKHVEYLASADYELLGKPGEYFSYCNDTFLLNGLIIESKTGQLYRRYMTQHILDAAGMNRTSYNIEETLKMGNVSTPYVYNKKTGQHEVQPWPALGTYEVGGGVRSSVLDLAKYGQIYLNEGVAPNGKRIVSEEGIRRMWTTPMYPSTRNGWYNLALVVTPNYDGRGITLVEHGGSQPGVSSNFGFVPEKGIAVSVLTNVTGVPAAAIWLAAVNTTLGLPLHTQRSVETEWIPAEWPPAGMRCVDGHKVPGAPRTFPPSFEEHLLRFCGTYRNAEGGNVAVTAKEGRAKPVHLTAAVDGEEFTVLPSDERTLFFTHQNVQQTLRFYFDEAKDAEHPWAVLAGSRMLSRS